MKLFAMISLLALMLLGVAGTAFAQQENQYPAAQEKPSPRPAPRPTPAGPPQFGQEKKKCPCEIAGTWKAQITKSEARLYEFDGAGGFKMLSVSGDAKPREIATATYEITEEPLPMDAAPDQKPPDKQITFTTAGKNRIFGRANATMKVVGYDDSSLTCEIPGVAGKVRWTRVDPDRYFIILVARQNEFYDHSGSAFPLVVKLAGGVSNIEAAGTYSDHGKLVFGAVPPEIYKDYLRDARGDSEVILRLEINSQQYGRALKVVQEWQRRAREHSLLYTEAPVTLNNILLVKNITETLNLCQNDFDLYKLDYSYPGDWITDQYSTEFVPFFFFKELKRRNEARNIEYKKFQELVPLPNLASR
jgi:hypothetical protein